MLSRQVYDRRVFVETARKHDAEIRVATDARLIPRVQGTAVVMEPAILLHYVFSFQEEGREHTWVFQEYIADNGGKLDISGSLLDELRNDEKLGPRLVEFDRTMALPPRRKAG